MKSISAIKATKHFKINKYVYNIKKGLRTQFINEIKSLQKGLQNS